MGSRRSLPLRLTTLGMQLASVLQLAPLAHYHYLMYGQSMYFDLEKPRRELNWEPQWSNAAMMCQSYDWYLSHATTIKTADHSSPHQSAVKLGLLKLVKWVS